MTGSATRRYRVASVTFGIRLETPWKFMQYSAPVAERIEAAAAGKVFPVLPVRAGDQVPSRTFIRNKSELHPGCDGRTIDLSTEEPFLVSDKGETAFILRICDPAQSAFGTVDDYETIFQANGSVPSFTFQRHTDGTLIRIFGSESLPLGKLLISNEYDNGDYYPEPGMSAARVAAMTDVLLRMMLTFNSARYSFLMMHSSVIAKDGEAVMFLGPSGTGKSTHSRLWLENVPGTELVNDDNPVIRFEDNRLQVYGTPWSGKTPCYRNIHYPVKAIVCLRQGKENRITKLDGLFAYAAFIGSASGVRWDSKAMGSITSAASNVAMSVPIYSLECLPDADAARVCAQGIGMLS